ISEESYVNIMLQYRPMYKAYEYKELNRVIKMSEYGAALDSAKKWGLHRGFEQI
ncbi:radical SAM protein, partial [ANME-1 cluster archaeon GoMg4]|nr:radical SAM protein [ANME-1 cluster archaeon GoMg4]